MPAVTCSNTVNYFWEGSKHPAEENGEFYSSHRPVRTKKPAKRHQKKPIPRPKKPPPLTNKKTLFDPPTPRCLPKNPPRDRKSYQKPRKFLRKKPISYQNRPQTLPKKPVHQPNVWMTPRNLQQRLLPKKTIGYYQNAAIPYQKSPQTLPYPSRGATLKRGSAYPKLEGPLWIHESLSPTERAKKEIFVGLKSEAKIQRLKSSDKKTPNGTKKKSQFLPKNPPSIKLLTEQPQNPAKKNRGSSPPKNPILTKKTQNLTKTKCPKLTKKTHFYYQKTPQTSRKIPQPY